MPRIVIVGAGFAGITALQRLAASLNPGDSTEVVILERSSFFYQVVGAPRAYVDENYEKNMFIPFDKSIPANAQGFVRFVRAVVTAITPTQVTYAPVNADDEIASETQSLAFDYLILAMGSAYTAPIRPDPNDFSRARTEQKLREVRDHIAGAQNILVVGGGFVGCEVAGDIADHYPTKHVTLLASRNHLVPNDKVNDKLRVKTLEGLQELKVKVVLGERLLERPSGNVLEKRSFTTDKGTVIEADIMLLCAGYSPCSELVKVMDASLLDADGHIRVNDKLELDDPKYSHIFAIGDVGNHPTPKLAVCAGSQAKHLASELVAVVRKKQTCVTKPFPRGDSVLLFLSLGSNGGVSQVPLFGYDWVAGNFITRMFKAKDMMASLVWRAVGATMPQ
jgi:apoptosis-inducing factor 2